MPHIHLCCIVVAASICCRCGGSACITAYFSHPHFMFPFHLTCFLLWCWSVTQSTNSSTQLLGVILVTICLNAQLAQSLHPLSPTKNSGSAGWGHDSFLVLDLYSQIIPVTSEMWKHWNACCLKVLGLISRFCCNLWLRRATCGLWWGPLRCRCMSPLMLMAEWREYKPKLLGGRVF